MSRTVCSFTLQANLFQLFQPIGGVSARPFGALFTTSCVVSASAGAAQQQFAASTNHNDQSSRSAAYPSPLLLASCVSATNRRCKQPRGESCDACVALLVGSACCWSLGTPPMRKRPRFRSWSKRDGKHALHRRRRAVPDPRRADQQQQQLSSGAAKGLAGHPTSFTPTRVEIPVAWEQIEPVEGPLRFLVGRHAAPAGAAATTSASSCSGSARGRTPTRSYAPEWVKADTRRFPRDDHARTARLITFSRRIGRSTLEADSRAFAALMRHMREIDPQHTRHHDAGRERDRQLRHPARFLAARRNRLFAQPIPAELARKTGKSGTWSQVFGWKADQAFNAWYIARYVDQVAAAGTGRARPADVRQCGAQRPVRRRRRASMARAAGRTGT